MLLKSLSQLVRDAGTATTEETLASEVSGNLLTSVWEAQRPSCPKRATLGKFTLGILPPEWDDFVQFHVNTLKCSFCNANLAELQTGTEDSGKNATQRRLFESTVGFLKMPSE